MRKEAYYFSHDANAMDDPKCMMLIDQLGMEGYGIFWGLIERLRQEKEYKLPISVLPSLAKRWGTSTEKMQTVVSKYGLFIMDEMDFFSDRLRRSMEEKSLKGRNSANIRWGNASALQTHSERNAIGMQNDAIKVKESKVKESKGKVFTPPKIEEVIKYFTANGYKEESAKKAFNYYSVANWRDSKDKQVKNWKQKMQGVWFKEENKETIKPGRIGADGQYIK